MEMYRIVKIGEYYYPQTWTTRAQDPDSVGRWYNISLPQLTFEQAKKYVDFYGATFEEKVEKYGVEVVWASS